MDMDQLIEMYKINSCSGNEQEIQNYIRKYLDKMNISYNIDNYNQTYQLSNKNQVLLSCHTDQVGAKPLTKITIENGVIRGNANLGADDKNGIWIVLNLLKLYPNMNFIFSTEEEIGGNVDKLLHGKDLSNIPYCLVFDRKGNSDIIGVQNDYCIPEFESELSRIGEEFGYSANHGVYSDADAISKYVSCVNLSCGYYHAHTEQEYTVIKDLYNCLDFAKSILDNVVEFYPAPEKDIYSYSRLDWLDWDADNMDNTIFEDTREWIVCPECNSDMTDDELDFEGYHCPYCQSNLFEYFID